MKVLILACLIYFVAAQTCCCYPNGATCGSQCLQGVDSASCESNSPLPGSCTAPSCADRCAQCIPPNGGSGFSDVTQQECASSGQGWRCVTADQCCCYATGESVEGACIPLNAVQCELNPSSSCTKGAAIDEMCLCTSNGATGALLTRKVYCTAPNFCITDDNLPNQGSSFSKVKQLSGDCENVQNWPHTASAGINVQSFTGGGSISMSYTFSADLTAIVRSGQIVQRESPYYTLSLFQLSGPFATASFNPPPISIGEVRARDIIDNPQKYHLRLTDVNGAVISSTPLSVDYECPKAGSAVFVSWQSRTAGTIQRIEGPISVSASECGQTLVASSSLFPAVGLQNANLFNPTGPEDARLVFLAPAGSNCVFTLNPPIRLDFYGLNLNGNYATTTTPNGIFPQAVTLASGAASPLTVNANLVMAAGVRSGNVNFGTTELSALGVQAPATVKRGNVAGSAYLLAASLPAPVVTPTSAPTVAGTTVATTAAPTGSAAPTVAPTLAPTLAPTAAPTLPTTDITVNGTACAANYGGSTATQTVSVSFRLQKNTALNTATITGGFTAPAGVGSTITAVQIWKYATLGTADVTADALQTSLTGFPWGDVVTAQATTPGIDVATFDAMLAFPDRYYFSVRFGTAPTEQYIATNSAADMINGVTNCT